MRAPTSASASATALNTAGGEPNELGRIPILEYHMITDGESQVSPAWLQNLQAIKNELKFQIFAVLVDLGSSELSTLAQLADRVTSVSKLTSDSVKDIFVSI